MLFAWRVFILFSAGPSKTRKPECANVETVCENCIQRELRFEMIRFFSILICTHGIKLKYIQVIIIDAVLLNREHVIDMMKYESGNESASVNKRSAF